MSVVRNPAGHFGGDRPDPVTISVDGVPVTGRAGQTIAAVLLAAGETSWRTTSFGEAPRGLFCGIGVCFDCVVEVNGLADVRACLRRAHDGDVVVRQQIRLPGATS
ncbi:(2Fe-2S)-binding protein [Terrabacter sp. MAHUQ-38]|uniref:(2Fe-2S)-binding protein n=1 Tax=unclassified Terrabacter TaxID=2630222 RepID=UPI00165D4B0B|nr:(2Fe-2S)-binding protein [Terrabacter sp. MAHUQ-38]MBC9822704.1 (2Fe-2S)-binding protein [Terrabacter sp. MAHUQ-38]